MTGEQTTGGWNANSFDVVAMSQRDNTRPISYGLDDIMSLSPKIFNYRNESQDRIGFIAQDVVDILPELVTEPDQDVNHYSLNYDGFIPVFAKAIQELKTEKDAEIDELELQNYELQRILSKLEGRIRELEKK